MADLFDGYGATTKRKPAAPAWDEMFADPGQARSAYAGGQPRASVAG